jgi:HAMP domain-containing protein
LLALLTAASIVASIIGSVVLARRITQPLAALSRFASRVRDGDYRGRLELDREDEVGALSASFNHMLDGIEARQAEILRLAYEDTVTGVPNRVMFNLRLKEAVRLIGSRNPCPCLDGPDRFKFINDTLGHHGATCAAGRCEAPARISRELTPHPAGRRRIRILLTGGDPGRAPAV